MTWLGCANNGYQGTVNWYNGLSPTQQDALKIGLAIGIGALAVVTLQPELFGLDAGLFGIDLGATTAVDLGGGLGLGGPLIGVLSPVAGPLLGIGLGLGAFDLMGGFSPSSSGLTGGIGPTTTLPGVRGSTSDLLRSSFDMGKGRPDKNPDHNPKNFPHPEPFQPGKGVPAAPKPNRARVCGALSVFGGIIAAGAALPMAAEQKSTIGKLGYDALSAGGMAGGIWAACYYLYAR